MRWATDRTFLPIPLLSLLYLWLLIHPWTPSFMLCIAQTFENTSRAPCVVRPTGQQTLWIHTMWISETNSFLKREEHKRKIREWSSLCIVHFNFPETAKNIDESCWYSRHRHLSENRKSEWLWTAKAGGLYLQTESWGYSFSFRNSEMLGRLSSTGPRGRV